MDQSFKRRVDGFLLDPMPGSDIWDIAKLTITMAESMPFILGFIFNGLIIRIKKGDTPESVVQRYRKSPSE